ncbi:hypothetical protein MXD58_028305, partial [Frankia sp. AgKG'84/4]|nr:hypothetical protein [Frankia sp. AgKG'84/4]
MTEQRRADVGGPTRVVEEAGGPQAQAVWLSAVRGRLAADCGRCVGLCCVAPGFTRSADFPLSKPPGVACGHLSVTFGCAVHDELRPRGFHGCVVFDCAGAGQQVTQVTFAGRDWRTHPATATAMFDVFAIMRALHESLRHLTEARALLEPVAGAAPAGGGALLVALRAQWTATVTLTDADADTLLAFDLSAHQRAVHTVLTQVSVLLRAHRPAPPAEVAPVPGHAGARG